MTNPFSQPPMASKTPPRRQLLLIIYIATFGVIWGLGTSLLAGTLPPDPITRVVFIGWFEVLVILLTKVVIRRPLSVMCAILIASTISIFTFSFGPPNPYKPLFFLAGFAFDLGTFFRTKTLRAWNLILGSVTYIATAACIFMLIFFLLDPASVGAVAVAMPFAAAVFIGFAIPVSFIYQWYLLDNPPARLREVWRQLEAE